MTGTTDEIWQAIEPADHLPHGRARIARLEALAAAADQLGDAELGTSVRLSLLPACLYGGEHQRVPGLLGWLLQRYDEAPPWFGAWEQHSVLSSFTLATVGLLQHPDVPLAQLETALTTMARRYAAAGESPGPVLRAEFLITLHVSGPQRAERAFAAWVAAGRSPLSECAECERVEQVRQLAALGRHQQAVDLALPVLDGVLAAKCEAQPVAMIGAVLTSLLEVGQADRAAREHIRAVRLIRSLRDDTVPHRPGPTTHAGRAEHLLVCARSGRLQRGLELIESWLPWYARVGPPTVRLETAAAAGRLLRGLAEAGHGHLAILAEGDGAEPTTVDELGARLAHEARDLGARFDARNGGSTVGDQVERVLGATPLPDLPLDALTRSPQGARVRRPSLENRRGRRAVGRDAPPEVPENLVTLAVAYDAALASDSRARRSAVLDGWRELRQLPLPADPAQTQAAARLDGWLTIEDLSRPELDYLEAQQNALAAAELASSRLRLAGLPVEALLHEQAFLLAAAQAGRIDLRAASRRIKRLASEVGAVAGAGDTGLALSRVALMREVAAAAGHGIDEPDPFGADPLNTGSLAVDPLATRLPGWDEIDLDALTAGTLSTGALIVGPLGSGPFGSGPLGSGPLGTGPLSTGSFGQVSPAVDPLEAGLAALDSVPPAELNHLQLRAISRLLRLRAADEPPAESIKTLFSAIAVLPDGVRPLERALAGADLAGALQDTDPATGLTAWEQAIVDAETAGATALLGNLLAASGTLRRALLDPLGAAADLTRAVPLLDEYAARPLAAQARLDLSRVLLDLGRSYEAAEAAEAGLADLTDLLYAQLIDDGTGGAVSHLAGCSAFAAAEANAAIGSPDAIDRARELAERSADWHRRNDNLIAQAEAWQLAAKLGGPAAQVAADLGRAAKLAEAGGDWARAATCRRERVVALKDAEGIDAALAALAEAEAVLAARVGSPAARHASPAEQLLADRQLHWHRLAVAEQRARMLAVAGQFREAMSVVDGLEAEYQRLGDDWSARDLVGLRGQLRAELDDLNGGLADLRRAAEAAEAAGDVDQAAGLGQRLATVLVEAGRLADAEAAVQRFVV